MAINTQEITSLSDFIQKTGTFGADKKIWFRGLPDIAYDLKPSIFRSPFTPTLEKDFNTQFQSRAIPFLESRPQDPWEWQFVMQHFGVPTRLLDWTVSGLAALAFAVLFREDKTDNEKHYGKDAAIWCLDPIKLNSFARLGLAEPDKIPDISKEQQLKTLYDFNSKVPTYPVAITGPMNNERIVAQKGVFTLFPNSAPYQSLSEKDKSEEFLIKLEIKNINVVAIRKELGRMGMSESTLFPDLSHLAIELKRDLTEL
jgi:hypothetical protein